MFMAFLAINVLSAAFLAVGLSAFVDHGFEVGGVIEVLAAGTFQRIH